jgi:hypothetical protein
VTVRWLAITPNVSRMRDNRHLRFRGAAYSSRGFHPTVGMPLPIAVVTRPFTAVGTVKGSILYNPARRTQCVISNGSVIIGE